MIPQRVDDEHHVLPFLAPCFTIFLLGVAWWAPRTLAADRCFVESVAVVGGGLPVADLHSADAAAPPLATTLGSSLDLEITVACDPHSTSVPRGDCSWRVHRQPPPDPSCRPGGDNPISGETSWSGWRHRLGLTAPDSTGIYDLVLDCRVDHQPAEKIHRQLLVTWAEPLLIVSPPHRTWYERAACWGGGWGAEASEAEILKAMLQGIRTYGQRHWRYGYATHLEADAYRFREWKSEEIIFTDQVSSCDGGSYCKCPWRALVSSDSPCNFSDCYVFSDALLHIAATLGIGGLLPCDECTVVGREDEGFFTRPDASSLDPRFPRDILCGEDAMCPAYYFNNHSLLRYGATYYDTTFNETYSHPGGPVWKSASLEDWRGLFIGGDLVFRHARDSYYDNWDFFEEAKTRRSTGEGRAKVIGNFTFERKGMQEIFRALEVGVDLKVLRAGMISVYGRLQKDRVMIARRPNWWTPFVTKHTFLGKEGEEITVKLSFSGEQIYQSGEDGPWKAFIYLAGEEAKAERQTPPYRFQQFGELDVWMEEPTISWVMAEDTPFLRVKVPLAVRVPLAVGVPNTFIVQLNVAQGGRSFTNLGKQCEGWCRDPLVFEVPGRAIAECGLKGPCWLSLGLFQGPERKSVIGTWHRVAALSP